MVLASAIINCSIEIIVLSLRASLVAMAALVILIAVFGNLGKVYEESRTWILTCRSMRQNSWLARQFIATRELRVKVGLFFHIDRSLVLTILSIILTNTANVVMGSM